MELGELKARLKEIYERTGILAELGQAGEGQTALLFEAGGKKVEGYLSGEGEETARLAALLTYAVSNGDAAAFSDPREELKSILRGEGGSWRAYRYMNRCAVPEGVCFAAEVVPDRFAEETFSHIERCVDRGYVLALEGSVAVIQFAEDDQTPYEFGQFLWQSLYEELGVRASIGIGCEVKGFSEIASSYAQAEMALRMSRILRGEGEVHSYREYLLVRMLEDIPRSRLKEYIEQFRVEGAGEIFEDPDMLATAEEFLESSLNISETSRNLFMHRNTLTYRLDKIERATGLNIRKFSDAVTFRVLTLLYKLLQ